MVRLAQAPTRLSEGPRKRGSTASTHAQLKRRKSEANSGAVSPSLRSSHRTKTLPPSLLESSHSQQVPLSHFLHSQTKKTDSSSVLRSDSQQPITSAFSRVKRCYENKKHRNKPFISSIQTQLVASSPHAIKKVSVSTRALPPSNFTHDLQRAIVTRKQAQELLKSTGVSHNEDEPLLPHNRPSLLSNGRSLYKHVSISSPRHFSCESTQSFPPTSGDGVDMADSVVDPCRSSRPPPSSLKHESDSLFRWASHETPQAKLQFDVGSNSILLPHVEAIHSVNDDDASIFQDALTDFESQDMMLNIHMIRNIRNSIRLTPTHNYFQSYQGCPSAARVTPATRRAILTFFIEIGRSIPAPVSDFTLHMAINCFDRYLSELGNDPSAFVQRELVAQEIETMGAACLLLCSKLEDVWTLSLGDVCKTYAEGSEYQKADILKWELNIAERLQFEISSPTVFDFLYQMTVMTVQSYSDDHKWPLSDATTSPLWLSQKHIGFSAADSDHKSYQSVKLKDDANVPLAFESIIGKEDLGWSSPSYFQKIYHKLSLTASQSLSNEGSKLFMYGAAISEIVIFHHTSLGTPVHLIAAAAVLFAIVHCYGGQRTTSRLPQSIRLLLGHDRTQFQNTLQLVSAILAERQYLYMGETPKMFPEKHRHSLHSTTTASSYHISPHPEDSYDKRQVPKDLTTHDPASSPLSRLLLLLPASSKPTKVAVTHHDG